MNPDDYKAVHRAVMVALGSGSDPADTDAGAVDAMVGTGLDREQAQALLRDYKAERAEGSDIPVIEAEAFDFDADAPEPDWIVTGLIERYTVNVLSGDTGAAKSIHAADLAFKLVTGGLWLDRKVPEPARVLYVDEENPQRIAFSRLKALGVTNDHRDRLRYYRRNGVQLGDESGRWKRWIERECLDFKPDVVVVDTAMAAGGVDVNDNDAVVRFYTQALRPLAEQHALAVLILHHERKPGAAEKRNSGMAMMGARQWAGQADTHMTLTAKSDYTETPRDDGGVDTAKDFEFSVQKGRDGHASRPERTAVHGVKEPQGHEDGFVLTELRIDWLGKVRDGAGESMEDAILKHLASEGIGRSWGRKEVAEAVGVATPDSPDGTFKRAWKLMTDNHWADRNGNGVVLTAAGLAAAENLGLPIA